MGMVKAAIGQVEEAEQCFQKSIEVVGGNPIYDLGLSYLEAGRFYRTTGNKQKATRHLKKAEQIFTRMGATHFARKAAGELEKVMKKRPHNGRTPSSRSKKPPERADESPEPPAENAVDRLIATDRLRTLYEVSVALTSLLDLDALLNRCIDLLLETTRAERGLILLAEPGEELTIRAFRARRMDDREAAQISYSLVRDAMASGRPLRASDAASDPRFIGRQSVVDFRIRSVMCAPLLRSGRIVGALYVDHRRIADAFTEGDEEFLKAFGGLAAVAIENAEIHEALTQRALHLQQEAERRYAFGSLIGGSAQMQKVYALISNAAGHGMTALISGETGVGKELVARSIHYNSPRRQGPFIVQDCGAMPPGLLESELFGHRRGAYTGAVEDRAGLFEAAHGGTLFLDEIGSAPPEVQARLLRVLQEGEVRRVGETKARKVDVRVIAATNRDLQEEAQAGRFREDLFYRLSAFPIPIPPLRDRREDIPMLAGHFLKESGRALKKEVRGIGKEAMALLLDHAWPGNVRELENEIRRADALTPDGGEIGPEALSDRVQGRAAQAVAVSREGGTWRETVEQMERSVIRDALEAKRYNVTRTAEALGISRVTLQQKMKRYGLRTE